MCVYVHIKMKLNEASFKPSGNNILACYLNSNQKEYSSRNIDLK
jgi:hypothetical protein